MTQNANDAGWQQLEFRVNKFVGHFLKVDYPAIEYKTQIAGLLPSPLEYNEQDVKNVS